MTNSRKRSHCTPKNDKACQCNSVGDRLLSNKFPNHEFPCECNSPDHATHRCIECGSVTRKIAPINEYFCDTCKQFSEVLS